MSGAVVKSTSAASSVAAMAAGACAAFYVVVSLVASREMSAVGLLVPAVLVAVAGYVVARLASIEAGWRVGLICLVSVVVGVVVALA